MIFVSLFLFLRRPVAMPPNLKYVSENIIYRIFSLFLVAVFLSNDLCPLSLYAQTAPASTFLNLPVPGARVQMSQDFTPALLKGATIHADNPLKFDFIVGRGNDRLAGKSLEREAEKLIRYFLAFPRRI